MTALVDPPDRPQPVLYGGWRRARGIGLGGLGTGQTFAVLTAFALVLLAGATYVRSLLVLVPLMACVAAVTITSWDGLPLVHHARRRIRWMIACRRGQTRYSGVVAAEHPRAWQLPGVLAQTRLVSAEDGRGSSYGLVWGRRTGDLTATLRVAATSTWLANQAESASWVAGWGSWLASLGHLPAVRWVAVTVDTAPDPGLTLHERVERALDPAAPGAARQVMRQLAAASPQTAADILTSVSITFDPTAALGKPGDLLTAAAEVGHALTGLETALGGCGVTLLGRATAAELAGAVLAAFDPAARGEVTRQLQSERHAGPAGPPAGGGVLTWDGAGPVGGIELWDRYRHDSGISVSWTWREAPRQAVPATVLARLLTPGPFASRVTMLYRPLPAAAAGRLLEEQVSATAFHEQLRRRTGRDATARDTADRASAAQAAAEEAIGAGVTLVSLYATTTVQDENDLARAVADMEARAESAKIRLRRLYGGQAAAFAATLPCGICPTALASRRRR
jgi:hypothetical protein